MMIAFALCAALGYGLSDFTGGVAARRILPLLALWGANVAGVLLALTLLSLWSGRIDAAGLVDAVAAGVSGLLGLGLTYRLMASEPLSVVSPMTAALAAAIPLAAGVAAGERPSPIAWLGVAAAIAAVVLISVPESKGVRVRIRLLIGAFGAGLGFGGYFVLIAHAANTGGMPALAVARVTSIALLTPLVLRRRRQRSDVSHEPADRPAIGAVRTGLSHETSITVALVCAAGLADAAADACFLVAARSGSLSFAGVLTSLYPAVTVLLAIVALRERTSWRPCAGIGLSLLAVTLIAA